MVAAADSRKDLTTTIHLTALRSVESSLSRLIEESGPELIQVLNALAENSAMLVSLIGPSKGARYLLEPEVTQIGRATTNEIFLDDVTVSRKHAQVLKREKRYFLQDLGSLNGTYLNGELVSEKPLNDGDELQIGKYRMHFFQGGKVRA
ncbi:MAG: FHA domain-containing protein [Candidatus Nanopelagicaceae bacterium]|nr:FHA domain-containing protein [Actinomycetota bacterium]NCV44037.1 FHA domain-containing protein [Actinomycetota bacterium]NCV83709.1 FHA domain-containing protein [Actinomycetota bacterium]NCW46656.1 FHA domain-containing protein [Actinomycetota bacterium]NCW75769.1 FHA domain-containing protein [Actinomycetota bacterium]